MFWNKESFKLCERDFPGSPVVKNPPSNAGDLGSIPGRGTKIAYDAGQLCPCTASAKAGAPQQESPHATNYRAHALWSPHVTTRERKPASHN